jgi:hypothetical protein
MKPTQIEWLTVKEAAGRLSRSERRVQDLAGEGGPLRSRKDPDSKNNALQIHAGDVERLIEERAKVGRKPSTLRAPIPPSRSLVASAANGAQPSLPTDGARAWLRVPELAAKWEVSEGAIYELIRSGQLAARRFSCRDPWRIHRADAEALRGEPQAQTHTAVEVA